jgi:hypothetical protein
MRLWTSSALLAIAACATLTWANAANWLLIGMTAVLLVSAATIHSRRQFSLLLARGAIWASVTVSVMAAQLFSADAGGYDHRAAAMFTACACCVALLLTGRSNSSGFHPKAHSKILTLGLTLAVADVVALSGFAVGCALNSQPANSIAASVAALSIAIGVVGLYRLQSWGFIVSVLTNIIIAVCMLFDTLRFGEFRIVFLIPALFQLLLYLPVLFALLRKREVEIPAWVHAIATYIPAATLMFMMALALQPLTGRPIFEVVYRWLN